MNRVKETGSPWLERSPWLEQKTLEFREFKLKFFPHISTITNIATTTLFGTLAGMIVGQPLAGAYLGAAASIVNLTLEDIFCLIFSTKEFFKNTILQFFSATIVMATISLIAFTLLNLPFYEFGIILLLTAVFSYLWAIGLFLIYLLGDFINEQIKNYGNSSNIDCQY